MAADNTEIIQAIRQLENKLDGRFNTIDTRLNNIDLRISNVETRLANLEHLVRKIEKCVDIENLDIEEKLPKRGTRKPQHA